MSGGEVGEQGATGAVATGGETPSILNSSVSADNAQSPETIEALCAQHWLSVYRIVSRRCRSKSEAEELTQEVFLRALAAHHESGGSEPPSRAYLNQIARNLVVDRWRAEQRRPGLWPLDVDLSSEEPGPEEVTVAQDERRSLLAALDALPDRYSEVLRLRLQEGKSPLEVGVLMNINPNAVRQLQFRAIQALRTQLGHQSEVSE